MRAMLKDLLETETGGVEVTATISFERLFVTRYPGMSLPLCKPVAGLNELVYRQALFTAVDRDRVDLAR